MTSETQNAFRDWADYYRQATQTGLALALAYPSETLVRLFKGNYIAGMRPMTTRACRCWMWAVVAPTTP